ncbi:MAG: aminopeptidase P family protein [Bacteroidaceae bacterium]|nr:aminopeptidase P family protein [Bacteroidaceae bacterium]
MFAPNVYIERRDALRRQLSEGIILLLGNMEASTNYPSNTYHFRQDSSFLYFFGINNPGFAGVIDVESGEETIFGDDFTMDDIIWMGPQPSVSHQASEVGVKNSAPLAQLKTVVEKAMRLGRKVHFIPPYRNANKLWLEELTGIRVAQLAANVSVELIKAIVTLRSVKSDLEIAEIERACDVGYEMHTTAMRMCRPGVKEQLIAGTIEGIALAHGAGVSFPSILSMNGETLHNHYHGNLLEEGRLMLVDAGAETNLNYCSDFTRTVPVGGRFTQQQREVYNIVVAAHDCAIDHARPGNTWKEVHLEVCRTLTRGLKEIGLMRGDVDEAVAAGAHALFMPHGLGHMMGLDVHDMEDLGQIYVGYDDEIRPSDQFGLASLRMGRRLQEGFVITDEPGIYFIPALIDQWKAEGMHAEFLCYDAIEKYKGFGGIRLEDDVLITATGSRFLGQKRIPLYVDEVEEIMKN